MKTKQEMKTKYGVRSHWPRNTEAPRISFLKKKIKRGRVANARRPPHSKRDGDNRVCLPQSLKHSSGDGNCELTSSATCSHYHILSRNLGPSYFKLDKTRLGDCNYRLTSGLLQYTERFPRSEKKERGKLFSPPTTVAAHSTPYKESNKIAL